VERSRPKSVAQSDGFQRFTQCEGQNFMVNAAKDRMMEVALGKSASEEGESADVKKFGERMVTDQRPMMT
jgi:predicted outer membrane protein